MKAQGAVVDRLAGDRRVVGIHDAVDEADQEPACDQFRLPRDHALQQRMMARPLGICNFRIVAANDVIRQLAHALSIAACRKILECPDPDMAGRDAGKDGPGQWCLTYHVLAGQDGGE